MRALARPGSNARASHTATLSPRMPHRPRWTTPPDRCRRPHIVDLSWRWRVSCPSRAPVRIRRDCEARTVAVTTAASRSATANNARSVGGASYRRPIEQMVRKAVAVRNPAGVSPARIRGSDQHRAPAAALDQADRRRISARTSRSPSSASAIAARADARRNQQRFDVAFAWHQQRNAARELADFGQKLTWPLVDDRR